jgi:TolA-binding protein
VAAPGVAEDRLAEACEAQGRALLELAKAGGADAERSVAQGRARLAEAAAAHEQAATGREPAEQAPRLWRAADCHLLAGDHPRAAQALQRVVALEPAAERQVEAWFALAGTHRALKQVEQARSAYYKCIEYPNSQFTYKARFALADVELEQGNLEHAEEILLQNLTVTGPAPDRRAEEQSLYRLADLAYGQRKYDKAKYWLEKALLQFPGSGNELAVRDRLGDCYRKIAEQLRQQGEEQATGQGRLHYQQAHASYLEAARDTYQRVADELERRGQGQKLPEAEEALLRKALFVNADCLFELPGQLPEALRRYKQLADRYRGRVEGLMACKRLWHCCGVTGGDVDLARQALEATKAAITAARADLPGISDEAFKAAPDRSTRTDWQQWLGDIGQRLGLRPVPDAPAPPAAASPATQVMPHLTLPAPPGAPQGPALSAPPPL